MLLEESGLTVSLHSVTIAVGLAQIGVLMKIGGPLLREYKIWNRAKERLNLLWSRHCRDVTGDEYIPLENGKH